MQYSIYLSHLKNHLSYLFSLVLFEKCRDEPPSVHSILYYVSSLEVSFAIPRISPEALALEAWASVIATRLFKSSFFGRRTHLVVISQNRLLARYDLLNRSSLRILIGRFVTIYNERIKSIKVTGILKIIKFKMTMIVAHTWLFP